MAVETFQFLKHFVVYFNTAPRTFDFFYSESNNKAESDFEDFSKVWRQFEYGHKLQRYITLLHKFSFSIVYAMHYFAMAPIYNIFLEYCSAVDMSWGHMS